MIQALGRSVVCWSVGYNGRMIFRKKKRLTEMVDCAG